jgi:hypothetical protein
MPVDHTLYRLSAAAASNTGGAQDYITAWDTAVIAEPGTILGVAFAASSLTSNTAVHQVDVYRQASGVSGASNSATSVLTAPVALASNAAAATGVVSQAGARVATGDLLQLKTNEKLVATGRILGLTATVRVQPD